MITRSKLLVSALAAVLAVGGVACVEKPETKGKDRWVATQNTTVALDWDKLNEAYKLAEGPADLERRVNEIYNGEELISIAVQDLDDKTQVVTGFFDKNTDGQVAEPEKIFTIQRDLKPDGAGQYQTQGYGAYAGYHSPVMGIMTGMLMGSMMSSMFMPRYVPMYSTPYTTSSARHGEMQNQRSSYRSQHPERYSKASQTGRKYGGSSSSKGGSPARSRGGSRFGVRRARTAAAPRRLTA